MTEGTRFGSTCPVCGSTLLASEASSSTLLAVCDVLVVKALEKLGTHLIKARHGRYVQWRDSDFAKHEAHTVWPVTDDLVDIATRGAWDVVPLILDTHGGCCDYDADLVVTALDDYVHDLVITATKHDIHELAYRLRSRLDLPVYVPQHREGEKVA